MTVLIVDDTNVMRFILAQVLERHCNVDKGNIHEAENGEGAVKKYSLLKPDITFLDITMPDLDGVDVVKKILEKDPDAKIIMYTASTDEADVKQCIQAGAKAYIVKPPDPERVSQAVQNALRV